jgi:hypothetical protein
MINFYVNQVEQSERMSWWSFLQKINESYGNLHKQEIKKKLINNHISKSTVDVLHMLLLFPLKESYFYYLMYVNEGQTIDSWRVKRFLFEGDVLNAFYLSLGKFVECLMAYLCSFQGKKRNKTGYLITTLSYPEKKRQYCNYIWNLRIEAKLAKVVNYNPEEVSKIFFTLFESFKFDQDSDCKYINESNRAFLYPYSNVVTIGKGKATKVRGKVKYIDKDSRLTYVDIYIPNNNLPLKGVYSGFLSMGQTYNFIIERFDYDNGNIIIMKIN